MSARKEGTSILAPARVEAPAKLGADAVNFENMTDNILRSPIGSDVVFVQSNTATPLVKCLGAVKGALGW